jgi:hypothetical protein
MLPHSGGTLPSMIRFEPIDPPEEREARRREVFEHLDQDHVTGTWAMREDRHCGARSRCPRSVSRWPGRGRHGNDPGSVPTGRLWRARPLQR